MLSQKRHYNHQQKKKAHKNHLHRHCTSQFNINGASCFNFILTCDSWDIHLDKKRHQFPESNCFPILHAEFIESVLCLFISLAWFHEKCRRRGNILFKKVALLLSCLLRIFKCLEHFQWLGINYTEMDDIYLIFFSFDFKIEARWVLPVFSFCQVFVHFSAFVFLCWQQNKIFLEWVIQCAFSVSYILDITIF